MYIKSLNLTNFRNYEQGFLEFSPYTNIIYGNNAQGKTNLLEAVYLFAQGKSHRAKSDKDLIQFGKNFARIELNFESQTRSYHALMQLKGNDKKKIQINDIPIIKLSMLMNYLNAVMFSPEDLDLVKGSPSVRRKFLDLAISQLLPNYLSTLILYYKSLEQKNSLLKSLRCSGKKSDETLSVWNSQLAEYGTKLAKYRYEFIRDLNQFSSTIHSEISKEKIEITYTSGLNCDIIDTKQAEQEFLMRLENNQRKEIESGVSLFGIHRDDMRILTDGKESRIYASQGQQRTAVLSMKMAQTEYIHHLKNEYPILLLDDIMSELDNSRRSYLSKKIGDKQVLITCTDADFIHTSSQVKLFKIKQGEIFSKSQ